MHRCGHIGHNVKMHMFEFIPLFLWDSRRDCKKRILDHICKTFPFSLACHEMEQGGDGVGVKLFRMNISQCCKYFKNLGLKDYKVIEQNSNVCDCCCRRHWLEPEVMLGGGGVFMVRVRVWKELKDVLILV